VELVVEPAEGSPALDGPRQLPPGPLTGKRLGEIRHVLVPATRSHQLRIDQPPMPIVGLIGQRLSDLP
jgi:hypothetical protein